MKHLLPLLLAGLFAGTAAAQPNVSFNIDLVGHIDPDSLTPQNDNQYSGCWGWFQASKNKEYAISGARNGTWFIDVTNPSTPSVCAFVPGISQKCTWREVKTYQNYCYIASDVCAPNGFQIVDMQYLPDSVVVVHSDTSKFVLGHTLWVDQDKLYVGITNFAGNKGYSPMSVWSLQNPADPQLLARLEDDDKTVNEVHDMFVRNDTVYASAGWQGLRIYEFDDSDSSFTQIGSYSNYGSTGSYNHSSFLTQNGKYLVFCDESPASQPIRIVDVQNLQNIQPMSTWNPMPQTTPHNPYLIGDKFAIVSSYQDGILIYDISDPTNPGLTGFFDTYYQGGYHPGTYAGNDWWGNWGAYPWLPSGIIIANDMRNGVYLLDATDAYAYDVTGVPGVKNTNSLRIFPNPAARDLTIAGIEKDALITLFNVLGEAVRSVQAGGPVMRLEVGSLPAGTYVIEVRSATAVTTQKVLISGN